MPQPDKTPVQATAMGSRRWGELSAGSWSSATLLLGWFVYRAYYADPRTDDAYVQANTAALAAHVSGQIVRLPIVDNQRVKKGDLLFVVDPRPYKLALDAAKTKLNLTEIEINTLQDTINSAGAQLAERKIEAANARQYLDRIVPLQKSDFVTENDVVEARNKLRASDAGVRERGFRTREGTGCVGNTWRRQSTGARGAGSDRGCATELQLLLCAGAVRRVRHESEHLGGTIRQPRSAGPDAGG